MTRSRPEEFETLYDRLQSAIRADPEWFFEYEAAADPGPLPYHEKMGLTRQEYERYNEMLDHSGLRVSSRSTLHVIAEGDTIRFSGGPGLSVLDSLHIDMNTLTLTSPFGTTDNLLIVDAAPLSESPWRGYRWKFQRPQHPTAEMRESGNLEGVVFGFTLRRYGDRPEGSLEYHGTRFEGGEAVERAELILHYDLSQP